MTTPPPDRIICEIFKSSRKDELYLYVEKAKGLDPVPEALLRHMGTAIPVVTLLLTPTTRLARARSADIMTSIRQQGFYLQMPPAKEGYLLDLFQARDADESHTHGIA